MMLVSIDCSLIGRQGGKSTSQKLEEMVSKNRLLTEYVHGIAAQIIDFVKEEEKKLYAGDVVMGSTDILESINGVWKTLSPEDALCGCTKSTSLHHVLLQSDAG